MIQSDPPVDVLRIQTANEERSLERLDALLAIPSISALQQDEVVRCAQLVTELTAECGFQDVQLKTVGDSHPYVAAELRVDDSLPTILMYAHYDVQPVARSQWTSDPFVPRYADGRLFARGSADDKGAVVAHLSAVESWIQGRGRPPINIKVLFDGEEEIGNPNLDHLLDDCPELFESDVVVIADSMNPKSGLPAITTSTRGVVAFTIELRAFEYALHSGFWGGPVPDPVIAMIRLLASLVDDDGCVAVKGIASQSAADDTRSEQFDENWLRESARLIPSVDVLTRPGESVVSRLWSSPSIAVVGFDVESVATASNTMLPQTRAKVSIRLPPKQDPSLAAKLIEEHLVDWLPWGLGMNVTFGSLQKGWSQDPSTHHHLAAQGALESAFGSPVTYTGMGATLPLLRRLQDRLPQSTILLLGIGDPHSNAHGADESLLVDDWRKLIVAETLLIEHLSRSGTGLPAVSS